MNTEFSTVTLNDGFRMPVLGLGVYKALGEGEVERAIAHAVNTGYRLIDTASVYKNEEGVGRGIRACSVSREELFVTTKIWNNAQRMNDVEGAFHRSLDRLKLDYVDLYLIHWPVPGCYTQTWKALEKIQGLPNEAMLSRLTLRTMKQAKYTTECSGHFGLAARYYCHFTSPIRRYPDLQIHRIIRDNLRGRLKREGKTEHYREILEEVARQSSVCERRAQEAERESDKMKKAEYMSYHLGEEFEGIISGVTGYGLYVELDNTVEGLVHISSLRDDYYSYDPEKFELQGELTKKVYHLGQRVRVRTADADAQKRTVEFVLLEDGKEEDYAEENRNPADRQQ